MAKEKDPLDEDRGFPTSVEHYYSDLHSGIVDEVMKTLERMDIPDDVDHRKALAVALLDMAALWAVRTEVCNTDFFQDMAGASYEEALLLSEQGLSRLKKEPLN